MGRLIKLETLTDPDKLNIYIYGDVQGDYQAIRTGEIRQSETSARHFKEQLLKHPKVKEINLFVNSWGGAIREGIEIRNLLKDHPAKVTAYVDGFACSTAAYILTGCDKVVMYPSTMQMLDEFYDVCIGNAKDHRKKASALEGFVSEAKRDYLKKTSGKISEKKLGELMDKATWLTAEECLNYGLADEIDYGKTKLSDAERDLQMKNLTFKEELARFEQLVEERKQLLNQGKQAKFKKMLTKAMLDIIDNT